MSILDSYEKFLSDFNISKTDFWGWGLNSIIYPSEEAIEKEWTELKNRIKNNKVVTIRGYGREAHATDLYKNFYAFALNHTNIKKDPSNNTAPRKIITKTTGFKNNQDIFNYQVAHIFGHTKNIFMFEAPWNICYIPKLFDPFTGHESKGIISDGFKLFFIYKSYEKNKKYIEDYNRIIDELSINKKIDDYVDSLISSKLYDINTLNRFKADIKSEFSYIKEPELKNYINI